MRKTKFQIKREETYERLIQVGMRLLCDKGYSSTNIDEIAKTAGYTKGAFYVHFKNKEDFFFHLLDYRFQLRTEWTDPETSEIEEQEFETLEASIAHRIGELLQYLNSSPGWIMVYIEFYLLMKHHDPVRVRYTALLETWIAEIEQFIASLQSRGWVTSSIDRNQAARNIFAMLDGMILHYHLYGDPLDARRAAAVVMGILR